MDEAFSALTTIWRERGLSPSHLTVAPDGTLSASDRHLSLDSATVAAVTLGEAASAALVDEPLAYAEELGRGGMGVVHLAKQEALRRDVAVKRLQEGGAGLTNLLKEAWVGGHLEHPNIVPVHSLATGPAVVMKRIEGTSWRDFARAPETVPDADDPLAWHLDKLLAVCDAIEFAHSRGVLHLDLKPDNVMIGAFGEVYVVDWGLAAGHGDEAPPWLPPAEDLRAIAGTPDYMAPELAMGEGPKIGPWTDVYLMGSMLHEALTGRPPHVAELPIQKLYKAFRSEPQPYDDDVPEELVAILHRAMHVDPTARYPTVHALREALRAFLSHREAAGFAEEARARLAELDDDALDEAAVWQRFGACRFALREVEGGWAAHPELPALEARLAEVMATHAMRFGRLELAEAYLEELGAPSPSLRTRLDALRDEAAAEAARVRELEAMASQLDLDAGHRFRSRLAIFLGALFLLVNVAMGWAVRAGHAELGYREMLVTGGLSLAAFAPFGWWRRKLIFRNRANSAIWWVCIGTFFAIQGLWLLGPSAELPFRAALALTPVFYLLAFGAVTVLVSTRFFWSPLTQVFTVLGVALFPAYVYEIIGVGAGLGAAAVGLVYLRPREEAS